MRIACAREDLGLSISNTNRHNFLFDQTLMTKIVIKVGHDTCRSTAIKSSTSYEVCLFGKCVYMYSKSVMVTDSTVCPFKMMVSVSYTKSNLL